LELEWDARVTRQFREFGDRLRRKRYPHVARTLDSSILDLSRVEDLVESRGQRNALGQFDQAVDAFIELTPPDRLVDVDGDHQMPASAPPFGSIRTNDVCGDATAREHPGEDVHHERDAVAFVTADRKQDAVDSVLWVVGRGAISVDRPAIGDLLTLLQRGIDLPAGDVRV